MEYKTFSLVLAFILCIIVYKPSLSTLLLGRCLKILANLKTSYLPSFFFYNSTKQSSIIPKIENQTPNYNNKNELFKKNVSDQEVLILFGSQSGTGENFAKDLETSFDKNQIRCRVVDSYDFDKETFADFKFVVLLMATYGEGDPTPSSEDFWEWLSGDEAKNSEFSSISFAVFGLGSTEYEYFNAMGKKTYRRLCELKAVPLCKLGLGDDSKDIEKDFYNWKENLIVKLEEKMGKKKTRMKTGGNNCEKNNVFRPHFEAVYSNNKTNLNPLNGGTENVEFPGWPANSNNKFASAVLEVEANRPLSKDGRKWQTDFRLQSSMLVIYRAGYSICVAPKNDPDLVDKFCALFKWDKKRKFTLKPSKWNKNSGANILKTFSEPLSVEETLTWYMDLTRAPTRSFIESLIQFLKDPEEISEVKNLFLDCRDENKYKKTRQKMFKEFSIFGVFSKFKSLKMDIADFIQINSLLLPREYTIASSHLRDNKTISIIYSLIEPQTNSTGAGVCTRYLKSLRPKKDCVYARFRPSNLILPKDRSCPVVMIAAGSGLAPFIGFLETGNQLLNQRKKMGPWCLFFGCRSPEKDYIYKDFLESRACKFGSVLQFLFVAFSRAAREKVYVQHLIEEKFEIVSKMLLKPDTIVFICGSTAMGRAAKQSLKKALTLYNSKGENPKRYAEQVMKDLASEGRVVCELWG